MLVSCIACSTSLRKSRSEISASPRSARWAFWTMRRYFVIVTPGIATGYWKAMKSPRRARSSGSSSVMSWPRKRTCPSVTSSAVLPMIALASVDLPEPLGPMSAWTSPFSTARSRPFRICLSPAATWRLRISSSDTHDFLDVGGDRGVGGDGARRRREGHEVGQGRARQRADDAALDARPEQLGGAALVAADVRAEDAPLLAVVDEAGHRRDRALQGEHRLVHRDRRGIARQAVAAVRAAGALDEGGLAQKRDDPLEVREGQALGLGDRLQRDGALTVMTAELDEQAYPVLRLRREDHVVILPTRSENSGGLYPAPHGRTGRARGGLRRGAAGPRDARRAYRLRPLGTHAGAGAASTARRFAGRRARGQAGSGLARAPRARRRRDTPVVTSLPLRGPRREQ